MGSLREEEEEKGECKGGKWKKGKSIGYRAWE